MLSQYILANEMQKYYSNSSQILKTVLMRTTPPNMWEGLIASTDPKANKPIQVESATKLRSQNVAAQP